MKRFLFALVLGCTLPDYVFAQRVVDVHLVETIDVVSVARGGDRERTYVLDDTHLTADADLARLVGWQGATAHVDVMSTMGGRPNGAAGTLQGVDSIEVASHHVRLFEAWVEQRIGQHSTVRAGAYDLNSEFYVNGAAGLLLSPSFGAGSELAATGPNGPSIFPSTALTVRVEHRFGDIAYARAAVLNGAAGCLGDPHGLDFSFRDGLLLIGEAGIERPGLKIAGGYWRYTKRHDDYTEVDADGVPLQRVDHGGYAIAELQLTGGEGKRSLTVFGRAGMSGGAATPFQGGWQAGFLVERLIAGRPDSQASFGMSRGVTTPGYGAVLLDAGARPSRAETSFELTYSDQLATWLTVQPDLQFIADRGGVEKARGVVVGTLRLTIAF
ncbi:carbohydrate porin [Sphingomonas trueperi]|uniref:Porin n=1 Tax=Sphingomonas trueperi TaxID=53317 RepID=A0A7X5XYI7_9SPHN|nr:carbohydrate porin [Sphingomonas trueperi]NJB97732.1 porin [Sphingomonas trueperi]